MESLGVPRHKPKEETEARKYTGADSEILRGEKQAPFGIGGSGGGVVAQEKVTVVHNEKTREVDLVTKYFKQLTGPDSLESAMSAFKLLKEAGVKHIPVTYRQVGPTEILMTDYNRDDKIAVGGNDNEKAKDLCINSVSNLPELLSSINEDIQRATDAGINIYTDCYFLIIPKSGEETRIDFVIGDLGGIGYANQDERSDLYSNNVKRVEYALLSFISLHVNKKLQKEYAQRIREWATSLEVEK